ncbi:TetR/AcrR family transcriptional regulator [Haloechinothrix sp. LS1_15]|nr:TetR/AcrR family transcriptional regulator [Haloechinothrix sp. LS1_15]
MAAARARAHQVRRTAALDAAGNLLERAGPGALTMRRIATELGCSTTVLYTIFGGKAGIAEELWREGFERLHRAMDHVPAGDPLSRLTAMGWAYRDNALANSAYYAVMFQRAIPGFTPSEEAYAASLRPLHALADAVARCIDTGVFAPADPLAAARVLWAAAHGAVSLELAGFEGRIDAEERYATLLGATAAWFMADQAG